jgi:hypothetical protein
MHKYFGTKGVYVPIGTLTNQKEEKKHTRTVWGIEKARKQGLHLSITRSSGKGGIANDTSPYVAIAVLWARAQQAMFAGRRELLRLLQMQETPCWHAAPDVVLAQSIWPWSFCIFYNIKIFSGLVFIQMILVCQIQVHFQSSSGKLLATFLEFNPWSNVHLLDLKYCLHPKEKYDSRF